MEGGTGGEPTGEVSNKSDKGCSVIGLKSLVGGGTSEPRTHIAGCKGGC